MDHDFKEFHIQRADKDEFRRLIKKLLDEYTDMIRNSGGLPTDPVLRQRLISRNDFFLFHSSATDLDGPFLMIHNEI